MSDSLPPINISPEAIDYGVQKFLKLFGKDDQSVELADWFRRLQETAMKQCATVHCLGMRTPLAFASIYQPTRLIVAPANDEATQRYAWFDKATNSILRARALRLESVSIDEFVRRDDDALVFGGPGWEKRHSYTTFFVRH